MSLLRNFSPDGSEPDDDEQPPTAAQPDEPAQPDKAAPAGGQASGNARYAFAGPAAGTAASPAPAPAAVVPSEVIDEPGDPAEETPPAEPVDAEKTPPSGLKAYPPAEGSAPARETPPPEAPAPEAPAPETPAPEAAPPEAAAPETAPVPKLPRRTTPATVPSPRATGEDAPGGQPEDLPGPNLTAPLLGDATELRARWQRVQGDFVDDPQAAVSDAADLVGQTAEALMAALRQRQQQLRTAWQRGPANGQAPAAAAPGAMDTEHLRLMMQRYRVLFNELCRPS